MASRTVVKLGELERAIMDVVWDAPAPIAATDLRDVLKASGPEGKEPAITTVMTVLSRLEGKGFVTRTHTERGFVFAPAVPETTAKRSALQQVVRVFFNGSPAGAASALLDMTEDLDEAELDDLERLVAEARQRKSK